MIQRLASRRPMLNVTSILGWLAALLVAAIDCFYRYLILMQQSVDSAGPRVTLVNGYPALAALAFAAGARLPEGRLRLTLLGDGYPQHIFHRSAPAGGGGNRDRGAGPSNEYRRAHRNIGPRPPGLDADTRCPHAGTDPDEADLRCHRHPLSAAGTLAGQHDVERDHDQLPLRRRRIASPVMSPATTIALTARGEMATPEAPACTGSGSAPNERALSGIKSHPPIPALSPLDRRSLPATRRRDDVESVTGTLDRQAIIRG